MKGQILSLVGITSLVLAIGTTGIAQQATQQVQNQQRTVRLKFEWNSEVAYKNPKNTTTDSEVIEVIGLESTTLVTSNSMTGDRVRQCIANPTIQPDGSFVVNVSIYDWQNKAEGPDERIERLTTTFKVLDGEEKQLMLRTVEASTYTTKSSIKVTPLIVK